MKAKTEIRTEREYNEARRQTLVSVYQVGYYDDGGDRLIERYWEMKVEGMQEGGTSLLDHVLKSME